MVAKKKTTLTLREKTAEKESDLTVDQITNFLKEQNAAYVLLTCSEPSELGQMQAEMSYSGDETLVSYLIDSAQHILTEDPVSSKDSC